MRVPVGYLVACLVGCQAQAVPPAVQEAPAQPQAPTTRNVVLITIDTLRADVLGIHGGAARTPVMDALADRGWRFDNAISASMLTNPSHASMMTSLYPRDHGVHDNESGIGDGVRTLAATFQRHGSQTAAVIGFPHLNPDVSGLGHGFDVVVPATRAERRAPETSRTALETLDRLDSSRPFFMWIHYVDPHAPYDPPATHPPRPPEDDTRRPMRLARAAAPGFQRNNPWFKRAFRTYGTVEELTQRYIAEVEATDAGLAVFLEGLDSRGLGGNTALVVTSDHGENLGEHGLYFHHGSLYRPTVHVPLIIAVPGAKPARVTGLVETVDIAPTALALVDLPRWEPMRGRSLVDVAAGREPSRSFAFSEHMLAQQVSVRTLDGALILHRKSSAQFPTYRFTAARREAYDLGADPHEESDLGAQSPVARELGPALDNYLAAGLHLSARPAVNQDRESLRALGYIE